MEKPNKKLGSPLKDDDDSSTRSPSSNGSRGGGGSASTPSPAGGDGTNNTVTTTSEIIGVALPPQKKAKTATPAVLPPMLKNSELKNVVLEQLVEQDGSLRKDDNDQTVLKALSVAGVILNGLKMDLLRNLCSLWNIKNFRTLKKEDLLIRIAEEKKLGDLHDTLKASQNLSRIELQGAKMRLLNVVFSDLFYQTVLEMNDTKCRAEIDKGDAGSNKRLWCEVSESYNDSAMNSDYGSFAFAENDHIQEDFIPTYNLTKYESLDWKRASDWFKQIVKLYDLAKTRFTTSGSHDADFMNFCQGKHFLYYYHLFLEDKPGAHKAFNVVLSDDMFGDSFQTPSSGRKTGARAANRSSSQIRNMEKKREMLQDVAMSMSAPLTNQTQRLGKRAEQRELEKNIIHYQLKLIEVPQGPTGEDARVCLHSVLEENKERVGELKQWFIDNPSPSKASKN